MYCRAEQMKSLRPYLMWRVERQCDVNKRIDPDDLASVADLAKEFGYHGVHFRRMAASKRIRAWRFGKTWVTTRDIIREYLENNPGPGRPPTKKVRPKKPDFRS